MEKTARKEGNSHIVGVNAHARSPMLSPQNAHPAMTASRSWSWGAIYGERSSQANPVSIGVCYLFRVPNRVDASRRAFILGVA